MGLWTIRASLSLQLSGGRIDAQYSSKRARRVDLTTSESGAISGAGIVVRKGNRRRKFAGPAIVAVVIVSVWCLFAGLCTEFASMIPTPEAHTVRLTPSGRIRRRDIAGIDPRVPVLRLDVAVGGHGLFTAFMKKDRHTMRRRSELAYYYRIPRGSIRFTKFLLQPAGFSHQRDCPICPRDRPHRSHSDASRERLQVIGAVQQFPP